MVHFQGDFPREGGKDFSAEVERLHDRHASNVQRIEALEHRAYVLEQFIRSILAHGAPAEAAEIESEVEALHEVHEVSAAAPEPEMAPDAI